MSILKKHKTLKEEHMLMNSIIRKTLGIKDHRIVRVKKEIKGIEIYMDRIGRRRLSCGQCSQRAGVQDRLPTRR
jgi:hypothetical protein